MPLLTTPRRNRNFSLYARVRGVTPFDSDAAVKPPERINEEQHRSQRLIRLATRTRSTYPIPHELGFWLSLQALLRRARGSICYEAVMRYSRREAQHAGSWYQSDTERLSQALEQWLKRVPSQLTPLRPADDAILFRNLWGKRDHFLDDSNVEASLSSEQNPQQVQTQTQVQGRGTLEILVVPHAGYAYSGETAAFAYAQVDPARFDRVVIIGPSHHVYMQKCGLSGAERLATPLGDLLVDTALVQSWSQLYPELFEILSKSTDEDEHSIEMQLPFLAKVFQGRLQQVRFVPIMCGALSPSKEKACGRFCAEQVLQPRTLLVVSTDFCHWGQRFGYTPGCKDKLAQERQRLGVGLSDYIRALDSMGMYLISLKDAEGFRAYLQKTGNTICGRHPLAVMLWAVHFAEPSAWRLVFLRYAQSSACVDAHDSSVSYVAGAGYRVYEEPRETKSLR
jgi:AmmeMemoRadiSam system protein B